MKLDINVASLHNETVLKKQLKCSLKSCNTEVQYDSNFDLCFLFKNTKCILSFLFYIWNTKKADWIWQNRFLVSKEYHRGEKLWWRQFVKCGGNSRQIVERQLEEAQYLFRWRLRNTKISGMKVSKFDPWCHWSKNWNFKSGFLTSIAKLGLSIRMKICKFVLSLQLHILRIEERSLNDKYPGHIQGG